MAVLFGFAGGAVYVLNRISPLEETERGAVLINTAHPPPLESLPRAPCVAAVGDWHSWMLLMVLHGRLMHFVCQSDASVLVSRFAFRYARYQVYDGSNGPEVPTSAWGT